MDPEVVETVTDWEAVPFDDGHAGLRQLADEEFSGAVRAGSAWAFLLNGRIVGIVDGTIESFADADGTAYVAPDPSLPLLFSMFDAGGEQRAKYYTNDTPLSDVDRTLKEGNFTGYVELSENVLSGDYYVVYHNGRSMSVAFVGASRRLYTGEEAFDRAADEVGIYEVRSVDVDVIELPESETGSTEAAAVDSAEGAGDSGKDDPTDDDSVEAEPTDDDTEENGPTDGAAENPTEETSDSSTGTAGGTESIDDAEPSEADTTSQPRKSTPSEERPTPPGERDNRSTGSDRPAKGSGSSERASKTSREDADSNVFSKEEQWRETRSIPSLDPSKSSSDDERNTKRQGGSRSGGTAVAESAPARRSSSSRRAADRSNTAATPQQKFKQAERMYKKQKERADRLEAERDSAREELRTAETRIDELESELETARAKIDELESELETASTAPTADADAPSARRTLPPEEALAGTNLFVRYETKGGPTLEKAGEGRADRSELIDNLRIEHHTTFETDDLYVDAEPFERFLRGRIEYGFTKWLIEDLLFEIVDTGNVSAMRRLYEAIPKIDRAEFRGTVVLGDREDDEPISQECDLVLRDRMGDPLFVANFNDSREPAEGSMVDPVVRLGSEIVDRHDCFGGVFAVTRSFFEPDAMEAANDATGSGLLSRNKRKGFVRVGRKHGFHLCLVETREGDYHMSEPELN